MRNPFCAPRYGIAANAAGDTLYVGEYIGPVDRIRTITPAPVSSKGTPTRARLGLDSFPNPTAGTATFRFTLGAPAEASLVACSVLGQKVARLADGAFAAGDHAVESGLPAGVYLVRLRAGGGEAVRSVDVC